MKKGFTLIELLVVVVIIGILAAIAVPQYGKAVKKSKMVQLTTLTKSLGEAEKRYFLEWGKFTTNFEELDINIKGAEFENIEGSSVIDVGDRFRVQLREQAGMPLYVLGTYLDDNTLPHIRYFVDSDTVYCTSTNADQAALCTLYGNKTTCPRMPIGGITCYTMDSL